MNQTDMSDPSDASAGENIRYTRYRPKMYMPRMSIFWWVKQKPYVLFIVRELTSVFVAAYAVLMIIQLNALSQGAEAWEALLAWFSTPLSIILHVVILAFVIFHSVTWFRLAPTAMMIRIAGREIPGSAIIAGNIGMWIVLSVAFTWLILSI